MSSVLGHQLGLSRYLSMNTFLHTEDRFLTFYVSGLSCTVCSFRPFWKWVGGLWGSLAVLIPLHNPCPFLPICHTLCDLSHEKVLPYLHLSSFFQPHLVLSHGILIPSPCLLPTSNSWLNSHTIIYVWATHISTLTIWEQRSQGDSLWTAVYRVSWFERQVPATTETSLGKENMTPCPPNYYKFKIWEKEKQFFTTTYIYVHTHTYI